MEEEIEICFNSFINIKRKKSGEIKKLSFSKKNEQNIYIALKQLGFGCSKTIKPYVLFFKEQTTNIISHIEFWALEDAFCNLLKSLDTKLLPEDVKSKDIMNAYYRQRPLKKNNLMYYYLKNNLSEEDHKLLLI